MRDRLAATYSRDKLRAFAAMADAENPKRRKGGRPKKKYRPSVLWAETELVGDVRDMQMQAASRGERVKDRAACMKLSTLPKYRKKYPGVNGEALYRRFRRAR